MTYEEFVALLKRLSLLDIEEFNNGDLKTLFDDVLGKLHNILPDEIGTKKDIRYLIAYLLATNIDLQRKLNHCRNKKLNEQKNTKGIKADSDNENESLENIEPPIFHFNLIGGHHKSPNESFFDLVRKTHSKMKKYQVKKVVLTDPYLYIDISAKGTEGGFFNLIKFLECVIGKHDDSFELFIPQSGKLDRDHTKKNKLLKVVKKKFPNVLIKDNPGAVTFHDRFYLTKFSDGSILGLFGPSLNGLDDTDVVIMGEIDNSANSMVKLKKLLNV